MSLKIVSINEDSSMTMTKYNDVINKNIILEDGCEFSDSCLNCPLPLCKYDDPILDKSKLKNNRNLLIMTMKNSEFSNKNIAKALKISTRTVHRVINNNKRGSISEEQKFVLELRILYLWRVPLSLLSSSASKHKVALKVALGILSAILCFKAAT